RALSAGSSDQRVVAGDGTLLDLGLMGLLAPLAQKPQVLEVGDGAMPREASPVSAGGKPVVERHRRDLALRNPHLDPSAHQAWVERVVAGVDADVGVGGH